MFAFKANAAFSVSGRIIEESTKNPLGFANIVLLALPDSVFVNGTTSGESGIFLTHTQYHRLTRPPF